MRIKSPDSSSKSQSDHRVPTITTTINNMRCIIFFALFIAASTAAPFEDDAIVDVVQDTQGYYKYTMTSKNITREEERQHDGSIKGFFSYIDQDGKKKTIHYTAGEEGFLPEGDTIPVDLPEVAEARKQHEIISEKIRSLLPALKSDHTVDEVLEVPLTKEEFLEAISEALKPSWSVGVPDTEEVAAAKGVFFKNFEKALE